MSNWSEMKERHKLEKAHYAKKAYLAWGMLAIAALAYVLFGTGLLGCRSSQDASAEGVRGGRRVPPVVVEPPAPPIVPSAPGLSGTSIELTMNIPDQGDFIATFDVSKSDPLWGQFKKGNVGIAGVHVYPTWYRGGLCRIDMRVSNGSVNPDGTGFCGKLYFNSITLKATQNIISYPRAGEVVSGKTYYLVPVRSDTKHVFLPRAQFERSFVLAPPEQTREAQAVLNRIGLPIADPVKNFGPTNSTLPKIDRPATDAVFKARSWELREAIKNGTSLYVQDYVQIEQGLIGYLIPDGEKGGDNPGGFGIELSQAEIQTPFGVLYRELLSQLSVEARNFACYSIKTGEPVRVNEWSSSPHRQNITAMNGDTIHELPCFLSGDWNNYAWRVFNPGFTCNYEWLLDLYRKYDVAHSIRGMRHLIPTIMYTNSQMAKVDWSMLFEDAQQDWSNRPDDQKFLAAGDGYLFPSLTANLYAAHAKPHVGSGHGDRACAWMCYGFGGMLKWFPGRADLTSNGLAMEDFIVTAADPFGFVVCNWSNPPDTYFPEQGTTGVQIFHSGLLINGAVALSLQLHNGSVPPEVLSVLERSYSTTCEVVPIRDMGYGVTSPAKWVETAHNYIDPWNAYSQNWQHLSSLTNAYMSEEGDPCPGYPLHNGALLKRITGKAKYDTLPLKYWHPNANLAERWVWLKAMQYKSWSGESEAVLEALQPQSHP